MAGAIDFESEFPKSSGTFLSQEQRNQLFEKLKHVVVIVNTEAVTPEGRKVLRGAGVILDKNGTMLTSEYLVAAKQQTILVRRVVDEVFWEAIVVKSDPKLDLAVLVPKNNAGRFHFATMDTEEKFDIGKEEFYGAYTKGKGKGKEKEVFTKGKGKGKEKEEFYGSHSKGKGKGKAK